MVVSLLNPLTPRERIEAEGIFSLKRNPGSGLCHVAGCRERHAGPKKSVGGVMFCHRHHQRRWRTQNPKQAAFAVLRMHAKKRRIEFSLTFARFVQITDAAGYWDQNPETDADRLTVDRRDMAGPYSDDNVRIIRKGLNSALANKERWLPANVQAILARKRAQQEASAWVVKGAREDGWLGEVEEPF